MQRHLKQLTHQTAMKKTHTIETVTNYYNEEFRALKVTESEYNKVFDARTDEFDYTWESTPGANKNEYKDILHIVAQLPKPEERIESFLAKILGNKAAKLALSCAYKEATMHYLEEVTELVIVRIVCDKEYKAKAA